MHPEIKQDKPGRCPICGMKLVLNGEAQMTHAEKDSYRRLFIIVGLITLTTVVVAARSAQLEQFSWSETQSNFMAGFFIVFSGFKLLDLNGFAQGYSTYDLLAKKVFLYGYIYPFVELTLGLLFLLHINSLVLNIFTFILMSFSGLGVAVKLARHEKFQCACLGTFLKVPLTKVTLIEDFGMAIMALLMIFM
jgi:hypothetical protein